MTQLEEQLRKAGFKPSTEMVKAVALPTAFVSVYLKVGKIDSQGRAWMQRELFDPNKAKHFWSKPIKVENRKLKSRVTGHMDRVDRAIAMSLVSMPAHEAAMSLGWR